MKFLNWKRKLNYQVIVLYRYDNFQNVVNEQLKKFLSYLITLYRLDFKYISFDTIAFQEDHVYHTVIGFKKIEEIGWDNIVSVTLYESDFRKNKVNYSFTFSIYQ